MEPSFWQMCGGFVLFCSISFTHPLSLIFSSITYILQLYLYIFSLLFKLKSSSFFNFISLTSLLLLDPDASCYVLSRESVCLQSYPSASISCYCWRSSLSSFLHPMLLLLRPAWSVPHVSLSVLRVLPRCHRTAVLHIQLPVVTFFLCVTGDKILASSYIHSIIWISANHPYCLCGQGESPLYRELVHSNASPPQAYISMCPSPHTNQPVRSIAPSPSIFDVRSIYHLRHNVYRPVETATQSTISSECFPSLVKESSFHNCLLWSSVPYHRTLGSMLVPFLLLLLLLLLVRRSPTSTGGLRCPAPPLLLTTSFYLLV